MLVCHSLMAFNIDPVTWKNFTSNENTGFGYKVIQKGESQKALQSNYISTLQLATFVTVMQVCGPTIPKNCDVTTYNGMCFKISSKNVVSKSVPSTLRECPTSQIDIAFLMDGSGSVHNVDFNKMKVFVIEMIKSFIDHDTQVGNAFNNVKAAKELAIIASLPTNKHVFKVTDFDALESIREQLKENIIAIEGYSLAIATAFGKKYAVMGAPRHKHTGQVTVSRIDNNPRNLKELDPPKPQIGSYFGAEVCVVDLNRDSRTVLLLVSAPTYIEPDREGKVFVYTFNHRSYFDFSGMELVGITGQRGRFGSSLASPADLNGDGYMDVLIGAPLEEDGQGSIYIFNGGAYQINPTYSQAFSEDALNPLSNQLTFTFDGLPSAKLQNIRPILLPGIKTTTDHNLDFEINCGSDDICVDDLRMDFNFSGSTNIEVGIMQEINVTVFVENRGENSYNTLFTLSYPFGLSYRRIISKQGRVECVSLDSEQKGSFGETTCHISKPILKGNSQAVFHITYSISKENTFDQNVKFTARINRHEDSTLHINFTAQKFDSDKPVKQILKVENDFRELSFKVFIRVPVMLGDKSIWANKNIQTGLRAAVFQLVSSASLDYDKSKYVFFSSDSQQTAWSVKIDTQVEVYEEVNLTKEIAGGVIGGLLLLALITVALYKAGFFKSHYKELLENAEQSPEDGPTTK
ncbi:hypothetical protein cypCar_00023028 [Cyprinus carpio]|nr:hypothetical protein cypCar_00023028 [Cyprinus carpio]